MEHPWGGVDSLSSEYFRSKEENEPPSAVFERITVDFGLVGRSLNSHWLTGFWCDNASFSSWILWIKQYKNTSHFCTVCSVWIIVSSSSFLFIIINMKLHTMVQQSRETWSQHKPKLTQDVHRRRLSSHMERKSFTLTTNQTNVHEAPLRVHQILVDHQILDLRKKKTHCSELFFSFLHT